MTTRQMARWFGLLTGILVLTSLPAAAQQKSYRLPATDLKQPIIWGAKCETPDGGLMFGGQDQTAEDGCGHTRIKVGEEWKDIQKELKTHKDWQAYYETLRTAQNLHKEALALARFAYFQGLPGWDKEKELMRKVLSLEEKVRDALSEWFGSMLAKFPRPSASTLGIMEATYLQAHKLRVRLVKGVDIDALKQMHQLQTGLEQLAEAFGNEPAPRALSPLVYESKTKVFVLLGGDHLDYLTNDTWTFNPAEKKWTLHHPKTAPPPRANHTLKANGDGTITLSGGYTYTSNMDYLGGQYRDIGDGDWTYDIAADTWKGNIAGVAPDSRTYRTGKFHPDFYIEGPKPDSGAFQKQLEELPPNTWLSTKPPHLPRLNRDWGTAILDPDRDLILRWSGGHSAHGGTDVLHYHIATNRWELPYPVEFPLGQLYTNTEYPDGFNFNRRPWITGHTYQNYGYGPHLKKMLFTGRPNHCYIYDPDVADWTGRFAKPKGMSYNSCFYTLTVCPTPHGLMCWTEQGKVFHFDKEKMDWLERPLNGVKLPGAVVDNSTVVHDSKRDRLLFVRKGYGDKAKFDGEIHALDLKTGTVSALAPQGKEAAAAIPYLCQLRYDAEHDLLLVGATLPPGEDGLRRTPAYDCAGNRWVSLKLGGTDPSGKNGRNVSLGMMYDAKRKLFWAVDTDSNVFVLRLEPARADVQALR